MAIYWSNEAIKIYLLARVTQESGGCWAWGGSLDRHGYALCDINGRRERAARVSYEAWVGVIPPGHDVHHTCRSRACINPRHLKAKERREHFRLHAASGAWAGSRNSQAKLTEIEVQFIRLARPFISAHALAIQHGIGKRNVYHIWRGEGWPHVGLPNFPARSLAEVLQDGRGAIQKALNVLLKIRADCQELGEPEPPSLAPVVALARFCCAGH